MPNKRVHPLCLECGKANAKYPRYDYPMFCSFKCALAYAIISAKINGWRYDKEGVKWVKTPKHGDRLICIPELTSDVRVIGPCTAPEGCHCEGEGMGEGREAKEEGE